MFNASLIRFGKKVGWAFGIDIKRLSSPEFNYKWLKDLNISTIFDIGANEGQFALRIHKLLPQAKIYSFEPLGDCYQKLVKNLNHLSHFKAYNFALGNEDRNGVEFHRSSFSGSSSLLNMAETHKQAFPGSQGHTVEEIQVRTLDGVCQDLEIEKNILVKIDVQGFENRVIEGGKGLVSRARIVITETSVEKLYEDQAYFHEIYNVMSEMGFIFGGCWDQIRNPLDGRILSCDAIFIKNTV
jgi:FkbM family methyltransferase